MVYGSNLTPPIVSIVALGFVLKVSRSIIAWIIPNYTMEMWLCQLGLLIGKEDETAFCRDPVGQEIIGTV